MTKLSTLVGAGEGLVYVSNRIFPLGTPTTGATTADRDYLVPFIPRKTVTVDNIAWERDNTTAANVYVGIYSSAGTLLTDCAVDTDTVAGFHTVATTPVTLFPGSGYFFAYNASADVAFSMTTASAEEWARQYGLAVELGASGKASSTVYAIAYYKARTNAALLSSLVMSGWSDSSLGVNMGFVPV